MFNWPRKRNHRRQINNNYVNNRKWNKYFETNSVILKEGLIQILKSTGKGISSNFFSSTWDSVLGGFSSLFARIVIWKMKAIKQQIWMRIQGFLLTEYKMLVQSILQICIRTGGGGQICPPSRNRPDILHDIYAIQLDWFEFAMNTYGAKCMKNKSIWWRKWHFCKIKCNITILQYHDITIIQ